MAERKGGAWVNDSLEQAQIVVNADGTAISAGGGGGTSMVDDSAFTVGVSSLTPSGGVVTADSVDAGDAGAFAMLANRQQKITLYDSSGVEVTSFAVTNAGTFAVQNQTESNTLGDAGVARTVKFAIIDAATSGDNTLVAAVASRKIRVLSGLLMAAGTVTARFESGASGTALSGQMSLIANVGFQIPSCSWGNFETAVNTLLNLELSAAVSVDGWLSYVEVA